MTLNASNVASINVSKRVSHEFRKAVEAVHSSSSLGFLAGKLLNVFVLNALEDLIEKDTFRISVKEAAELSGFNSKNIQCFKDAATELREKSIVWDILGKNTSWGNTSFLSEVKIENGVIEYSMPPTIRKLFTLEEGRAWAQINLTYVAKFTSIFTLRMYENCVRFKGTGSTGQRPVDKWRELLQAEAATYDDFRYFKRLIEKAIKEVNKETDLNVEPEYIKNGRQVVAICFYVTVKPFVKPLLPDYKGTDVLSRICSLGVTERVARKYVDTYELEYLMGNLEIVEQRYLAGTITKNPAAYLKKAFENDYRIKKTELELEREEEFIKKVADKKAEEEDAKEKVELFKMRNSIAMTRYESSAADDQDALIEKFSKHISETNSFMKKHLQKTGVSGSVIAPVFAEWLANEFGI